MSATKHAQSIKKDSKDYLTTALLQLLQSRDLHDIKIIHLVERAGVSRMAFYRNFNTLEDILIAYFKPKIDEIFHHIIIGISQDDKLTIMEEYFTEYEGILKLASKRNFEYIIQQIFSENMANFYDTNMDWKELTYTQCKYWKSFMSAGVYNIWHEWIMGGRKESLIDIHNLIGEFQNSTMNALLRQKDV